MRRLPAPAPALVLALALGAGTAVADEGGVGFWLPGNFASFAAAPGDAGWTFPAIYYRSVGDAGASRTFTIGGSIVAGVEATADFVFVAPTYTFRSPVAGAQAAISFAGALGQVDARIEATLTAPNGLVLSGSETDSRSGFSDLYPTATLKWNRGVHNYLAYAAAGAPVGTYDADRLANIGTNHWALDGGGGYTYFNEESGNEFSAVLGFTYNFENPDTDYRNGIDAHVDWAYSHLFSPTFHFGVVGYFYEQLTGDSGEGAVLGDFKSKVSGIGPQAGWFLENGWYLNAKGYYELGAKNRTEGWDLWVTVAIPLGS